MDLFEQMMRENKKVSKEEKKKGKLNESKSRRERVKESTLTSLYQEIKSRYPGIPVKMQRYPEHGADHPAPDFRDAHPGVFEVDTTGLSKDEVREIQELIKTTVNRTSDLKFVTDLGNEVITVFGEKDKTSESKSRRKEVKEDFSWEGDGWTVTGDKDHGYTYKSPLGAEYLVDVYDDNPDYPYIVYAPDSTNLTATDKDLSFLPNVPGLPVFRTGGISTTSEVNSQAEDLIRAYDYYTWMTVDQRKDLIKRMKAVSQMPGYDDRVGLLYAIDRAEDRLYESKSRRRVKEMALDEMGAINSGEVKPEHQEYHPSLSLEDVKKICKASSALSIADLAEGALKVTVEDASADVNNPQLKDISKTKKYYRDYYDVYVGNRFAAQSSYLSTLDQLTI